MLKQKLSLLIISHYHILAQTYKPLKSQSKHTENNSWDGAWLKHRCLQKAGVGAKAKQAVNKIIRGESDVIHSRVEENGADKELIFYW